MPIIQVGKKMKKKKNNLQVQVILRSGEKNKHVQRRIPSGQAERERNE